MTVILGIKMNDRTENAVCFQEILTKYGCAIKTRVGLHNSGACTPFGIILLEIENHDSAVEIEKALLNIAEIELQKMEF